MAISLASISKTTRNSLPPRVVVHGDGGVGKSTFAAGAYKPVFLPFEDGLSGLEVDAFPLLRSYQDAIDALASLASGDHDYGTAVVDSLDWFEPLVWEKVSKAAGKSSIEEIPYGKRSEEHTSELQSRENLVCRLLLEKKKEGATQFGAY